MSNDENMTNLPNQPDISARITDQFKTAFRGHAAGVALITASVDGTSVALTSSSVFSVSIDPPMLAFSLSGGSSSTPVIRRADFVVVHLLAAEDIDVARLGATSGIDRFADETSWLRLSTGEPVFDTRGPWIRARVGSFMEVGGSTIMAVEAVEIGLDPSGTPIVSPLVYHDRVWHGLGKHSSIS